MEELILVKVREIYIYIDNVQCNGSESHLEECPSSDVGDHDCSHSEDAGVSCQGMSLVIILHFREKHMGKCTCFYIAICTDGRVKLLVGEYYDTEYFKEDQSVTV